MSKPDPWPSLVDLVMSKPDPWPALVDLTETWSTPDPLSGGIAGRSDAIRHLGIAARLQAAVMTYAHISAGGADGGGVLFADDVDDWCGTGWPRRFPKPRGLDELLESMGRDAHDVSRMAAAVEFASLAARCEDTATADQLNKAAGALADASFSMDA